MSDEPTKVEPGTDVPPAPPVDDTPPAPSADVPSAPATDTPPAPPADDPGAGDAAEKPAADEPAVDPSASRTGFAAKGQKPGDQCTCPDGRIGTIHRFDAGLICLPNQG